MEAPAEARPVASLRSSRTAITIGNVAKSRAGMPSGETPRSIMPVPIAAATQAGSAASAPIPPNDTALRGVAPGKEEREHEVERGDARDDQRQHGRHTQAQRKRAHEYGRT
jgi:hypothetical protein